MAESRRELEECLRESLASAEERRQKKVAEKNVVIAKLTQAVTDQGRDLHSATRERDEARTELERLRVEMEGLRNPPTRRSLL